MKKLLPYIYLTICFSSCELAEIESYTGIDNIYINELDEDEVATDTSSYTLRGNLSGFIDVPLTIQVQGVISDTDRPYLLSIDASASTGQEGIDYTFLEEDFIIAAGAYTDTVYIRLFGNGAPDGNSNSLVLQVHPNNYFLTNYVWDYDILGEPTASRIRHTVIYGNLALEPAYWADFEEAVLGEFSGTKVSLLVEIGGLEEARIYTVSGEASYSEEELLAAALLVQAYIEQQAELGNIIRDENGNSIEMGTSA